MASSLSYGCYRSPFASQRTFRSLSMSRILVKISSVEIAMISSGMSSQVSSVGLSGVVSIASAPAGAAEEDDGVLSSCLPGLFGGFGGDAEDMVWYERDECASSESDVPWLSTRVRVAVTECHAASWSLASMYGSPEDRYPRPAHVWDCLGLGSRRRRCVEDIVICASLFSFE